MVRVFGEKATLSTFEPSVLFWHVYGSMPLSPAMDVMFVASYSPIRVPSFWYVTMASWINMYRIIDHELGAWLQR